MCSFTPSLPHSSIMSKSRCALLRLAHHVFFTGLPACATIVVCRARAFSALPCQILGAGVLSARAAAVLKGSMNAMQESYEYSDPITQFLRSLYVEYDFEGTLLPSIGVSAAQRQPAAESCCSTALQHSLLSCLTCSTAVLS